MTHRAGSVANTKDLVSPVSGDTLLSQGTLIHTRCMLTIYCEVHCLAELKALAQELDMKCTQSNLAKAQNNSS
jgi:hypothetical protein